jgi:hypothetical protein
LYFYFGVQVNPPNLPFQIYIDPGSSGGWHGPYCSDVNIHVDAYDGVSDRLVSMITLAEVSEVLMAWQGAGWNCSYSNGEALSRVLAANAYPAEFIKFDFDTAYAWLNSQRLDWIGNTETTDKDPVATGCSVLFLNFLRFQWGCSLKAIVQAGASNLDQTCQILTGLPQGGYKMFLSPLNLKFPPGTNWYPSDNPFPIYQSPVLCGVANGLVYFAFYLPNRAKWSGFEPQQFHIAQKFVASRVGWFGWREPLRG